MQTYRTSARIFLALFAGLLVTACGLIKTGGQATRCVAAVPGPRPVARLAATMSGKDYFTSKVLPYLKDATHCGACHGTQSPAFVSAPDAYTLLVPDYLPSFSAMTSSDFYTYAVANHHCSASGCDDSSGALAKLLQNWATVEGGGAPPADDAPVGGSTNCTVDQNNDPNATPTPDPDATPTPGVPAASFQNVGSPQVVKNNILDTTGAPTSLSATPLSGTPAPPNTYIAFDISLVSGAPAGAKLVFLLKRSSVATATNDGAYYLANPSVMSSTVFHLKGIHLAFSNGSTSTQWTAWDAIDQNVGGSATFPGTPLSAASTFVIIPSIGLTGDSLQLSAISAGPATAATPTPTPTAAPAAPTFAQVNTAVFQPYCNGCHGSAVGSGGYSTANATSARNVNFVTAGNGAASPLYLVLFANNPPGGNQMPLNNNAVKGNAATMQMIQTTIKAWIDGGAQP
jgi:mono/diheme cytochrome c family protein